MNRRPDERKNRSRRVVSVLAALGSVLILAGLSVAFVLTQTDLPARVWGEARLFEEDARQEAAAPMKPVQALPTEPAEPLVTLAPTDTPQPTDAPTPEPTATQQPTVAPTATPTPQAAAEEEQPPTGAVTGDVVNLRAGPGTNYPILGQVQKDQRYQVVARNEAGDWLVICCPTAGQEPVWISGQFVAVDRAVTELPVEEAPPTPTPAPVVQAPAPVPAPENSRAAALAQPAPGLPGPGGFGSPAGVNPLTGLPLPGERTNQRPFIVCINNDFAARPQFGLSQADVMYEYIMEGFSITRFSGVFYGDPVEQIGPIRSARLINFYLGALYDAGLLCSGASDQVRYTLKNDAPFPYLDIDLDDPSNTRYSVSVGRDYRTRLRTSTDKARRWLTEWGQERAPSLRGFTFGDPPGGGAPASAISIPYPRVTGSQVSYRYDVASGRYLRFLGGAPHLDGNTGQQLALDNVIVQFVPHEVTDIIEDSLGSRSIRLNLFGSGRALVFRNGLGYEGIWRSESRGDMPRFYTQDGQEIPLKPGRTWISVVPLDYAIGYQ